MHNDMLSADDMHGGNAGGEPRDWTPGRQVRQETGSHGRPPHHHCRRFVTSYKSYTPDIQ